MIGPSSASERSRLGQTGLFLVIGLLPPLLGASSFAIRVGAQTYVYGLAALGLTLAFGLGGQLSVATAALMAVGAYAVGIMTLEAHWPFVVGGLVGIVAGAAAGALLGLVSIRVRTHYLLLVSLGFHIVLMLVIVNNPGFTKGAAGLFPVIGPKLGPLDLGSLHGLYFAALILCTVGFIVFLWIRDSRAGLALATLADNEAVSSATGISVGYQKVVALSLNGAYAGAAGALFAPLVTVVSPDSFPLSLEIFFLVAVVVGGRHSAWGTMLSIAGLTCFQQFATQWAAQSLLIYGLLVMVVTSVAPGGLGQFAEKVATAGRQWVAGSGQGAVILDASESAQTRPLASHASSVEGPKS